MNSSDSLTILPNADTLNSEEDMYEGYGSPSNHGKPAGPGNSETKRFDINQLRRELCKIVHSHGFQVVIIVLVLLDCAIVISEIMLESSKNQGDQKEMAEKILHYLSLTILSLFMVEIIVKVFAMGMSFLKYKFEIFDAVVVIISFTLDIIMSYASINALKDGVEFIILLRLWRITRIINGIIISIKSKAEEEIRVLKREKEDLQESSQQMELKIEAQKKEINYLKEKLFSMGIDVNQISELRDLRAKMEESNG